MKKENFLWVDKYTPNSFGEIILPKKIKSIFKGIVAKGAIPNMILSGMPGTGKTTIAVLMAKLIGADYKVINASDKRNIDLVRVEIADYASSRSMSGKSRKVLILDESDALNELTMQALRNQIEKFSDVCTFIMTCNHLNKIIPALQSRCDVIEFKIPKEEKLDLIKQLTIKIFSILDAEKIEYDKQVIVKCISQLYPDIRKTLNRLQIYSNANSKIDSGILTFVGNSKVHTLVELLKTQNFNGVREWVVNNSDGDFESTERALFDQLDKIFNDDQSKVQFVVTSQKYQYQNGFSVDKEIHLLSYLIELMAGCKF